MAIWRDYFQNAYISCFHYLVKRELHWTERLFWFITIFICMCSTYYIISDSVSEYKSQKSVYRADTDYLEWETPFPSVVICEKKMEKDRTKTFRNNLNKTLWSLTFDSAFLEIMRENIVDITFFWPPIVSGSLNNDCRTAPEKCLQGNFSYVMSKLRLNCSELLTYCEYNDMKFDCCDGFLPVDTIFGKCYAFNNYGSRQRNGSRLTNLPWKIVRQPGLLQSKLFIEVKTSSLMISVLSPSTAPNFHSGKLAFKESIGLKPETLYHHYLSIKETITENDAKAMDIEKRGCRFAEENYLEYFDFYSQANCQTECYLKAQKKFCGCILHTWPVSRSEECNLTGLFCTEKNENILEYAFERCRCLPDCFHIDVETVGGTEKAVVGWRGEDKRKMRYVALVPAPSLRYIRYATTSPVDLLVQVGGTVGFFIGFSFLSIAQCFCYLFVRTVTDQYRLMTEEKRSKKQKMMDENFSLAKARLKMVKVEDDIRVVLRRKAQVNDRGFKD